MRKKAKLVSFLMIICIFVLTLQFSVSATGDANVVIGKKLVFEEGNEPFIANERTMMPLRAISEALDATVYWFNDEKRIQIVCYDTLLSLQIGNTVMGKYKVENGEVSPSVISIDLDVAPMIHNDRTYVPLRAISEAFDAQISWDNPNRSAIIIPKEIRMNEVLIQEMNLLDGILCATYGVICFDSETGQFYLRSLAKNTEGEYSRIPFCTPKKTSMSSDTPYSKYVSQYWVEQFGTENPTGMVVRFTGVTSSIDGKMHVILNKTTTGVAPLGYYDTYMKSIGVDYEPFDVLER